jgi:hypothetical protein
MHSKIFVFIFCLGLSFPGKSQQTTTAKTRSQNVNKPAELPDQNLHINPAKQAEFPTGEEGWKKYLEDNLDRVLPLKKHAPAGQYTVLVNCIISYWGDISDVAAKTRHGYGIEEEVVRVIKNSPWWVPARHGGKAVNSLKKLYVTFTVGTP